MEAQASSEIDNIVTTNDELFKAANGALSTLTPQVKEALRYGEASLTPAKATPFACGASTASPETSETSTASSRTSSARASPCASRKKTSRTPLTRTPPPWTGSCSKCSESSPSSSDPSSTSAGARASQPPRQSASAHTDPQALTPEQAAEVVARHARGVPVARIVALRT
nr:Fic/DOC family N-terminal domain-containing protein [Luteococcus japonicus]